nr:hypothetical protein [uncultured Mucilaginibacter sp.]
MAFFVLVVVSSFAVDSFLVAAAVAVKWGDLISGRYQIKLLLPSATATSKNCKLKKAILA